MNIHVVALLVLLAFAILSYGIHRKPDIVGFAAMGGCVVAMSYLIAYVITN